MMAFSSFSPSRDSGFAGIDLKVQRLVKSLPQGMASFIAEMTTYILASPSLSLSSHQLVDSFTRSTPASSVFFSTSPLSPPRSSASSSSARTILPLPSHTSRRTTRATMTDPTLKLPFTPSAAPSDPFLPPRLSSTHAFLSLVTQTMETSRLSPLVFLLALLYIDRYKKSLGGSVGFDGSAELVFMSALILANKYLDDNTFTNRTFSEISALPLLELNRAESEFLKQISFDLWISDFSAFLTRLSTLRSDRLDAISSYSFERPAEPPIRLPEPHPSSQWPKTSQVLQPTLAAAYPSPRLSYPNHLSCDVLLPQRTFLEPNPYQTVKRSASQAFSSTLPSIPSNRPHSSRPSSESAMPYIQNLHYSSQEFPYRRAKRHQIMHPSACPPRNLVPSINHVPSHASNPGRSYQPSQPSYHAISLASASSSRVQSPNPSFNTHIFDTLPKLAPPRISASYHPPPIHHYNPYNTSHGSLVTSSSYIPAHPHIPSRQIVPSVPFAYAAISPRLRSHSNQTASTYEADHASFPRQDGFASSSSDSSYDSEEENYPTGGRAAAEVQTEMLRRGYPSMPMSMSMPIGSHGYGMEGWRNGVVRA